MERLLGSIRGFCHTNLDNYKRETWPQWFVAIPRIGDRVESESMKSLKVCNITHASMMGEDKRPYPYIKVELS